MKRPSIILGLLAIAMCGCQLADQSTLSKAEEPGLEVERIAKVVVSEGTSKVLGSVRLPGALLGKGGDKLDGLTFVPEARLELVDRNGQTISNTAAIASDAGGIFSFPSVPLGVSMVLRARVTVDGRTFHLKKLLRPSEALTCAHLDLATTVIADKLLSQDPLVLDDPGLNGADLFELFNPVHLLEVEALMRQRIDLAPPPSLQTVAEALASGDTASLCDVLRTSIATFPEAYQGMFERPDSSLALHISAVGTNSIGVSERTKVFGVIHFKVVGAPSDTARVEFWAKSDKQQKVAESTSAPHFEATLDTWALPDGEYAFDTIVVSAEGRRRLLGQTFVNIENTLGNHCPLP